ncbi:MAG: YncE family protein [Lewinellaceae bacterium]|nr:YncE family protein [Lewinellaceae bacterium]
MKTVTENPLPMVFNVTGGGVRCPGDPGLPIGLDGSEPGVSYRLKRMVNGVTTNASAAISGTGMALAFGVLATEGTYTVIATTSAGCTATMAGSAVVTNSILPIAYSVTGGGTYCAGSTGVSFGLAGSQDGFMYQLYHIVSGNYVPVGDPIVGTGFALVGTNQPYPAGSYTIIATNADGCTRTMGRIRTVTVIPLPVVFNVTGGGAICPGTAGVSIGLDDSQLGVNYRLKRDGNNASPWISGGAGAIDFGIFNTPGTYTVMATTATSGCMADMNGSVLVEHTTLPLVFQMTGGGTYCLGGTGVPIGLSNSEPGVLYQLFVTNSNGPMQPVGIPALGGGLLSFGDQTIPGMYAVIATNAGGCTRTMSGSASVTTKTPPVASIIGINAICEGGSTTLAVTGGGTLPTWSTGAFNTMVITESPTVTTTYSVTVTNASNACTASASKTVIVHPKPTAFQVTGGGIRCVNAAGVPIGLDNSQTGVQYILVGPSNTTVAGPVPGSTGNPLAFGLFATGGTYSVVATNTSTLCTATMNGSAMVTVVPLPAVFNVTGGGTICAGDPGMPVGLSGSLFLVRYELYLDGQPTGITADGDQLGNPIAFGNQTAPGVYTVVATSIAGGPQCTQLMNGSVTITLIGAVVATISGPTVICGSSPVTLTASGGGTYLWSTGETTASIQVAPMASSSIYAVTVTWSQCSSSTSTTIAVIDLPSFAYSGYDQTICAGSSATLDANIPTLGDGIWSVVSGPSTALTQFDNPILPWATFNPAGGAGDYTLRWTISNMPCPATSDDVVITVLAQPMLAGSLANQVVCNGSLTAPVNFTGVPEGAVFQWTCDNPAIGLAAGGVSNIPAFTAVNAGTTPVVATVTVTPVLPGRFAYITNYIDHTVSVIEIPSHTVVATVPVGDSPFGVCVHPDGSKVYVTNQGSNTVSVINTATNTVGATIPVGDVPVGVCISRDGTRAYVTNSADGTVSVLNTATNSILATILVGVSPGGIAVSPDGGRVYVANSISYTVSVINTATNSVIATIGTGANPAGVVVSPTGDRAYVTNFGSNNVSVINTATNTVLTTVGVGDGPSGISIAPNGGRVYVSNNTPSTVSVINTATNVVVATISASNKPYGNSVTPDGSRLYVANYNSGIISATSTATNAGIGAVGLGGSGPVAFGNFIGGTRCTGTPISFTVTVNPSPNISIVSSTPSPSNPLNSTVTVAGFGGMPPYTYQRCPR